MTVGKQVSQAGHGYVGALSQAKILTPDLARLYQSEPIGTKVCLTATVKQILEAQEKANQLGIPNFLVIDSGCSNFYDGQPIITAIGFGPSYKHVIKPITKNMQLLK